MIMGDVQDQAMFETFRPSLEQAKHYQTQRECLGFIANLGGTIMNYAEEKRLRFGRRIL